jgi:hypothetical protein
MTKEEKLYFLSELIKSLNQQPDDFDFRERVKNGLARLLLEFNMID